MVFYNDENMNNKNITKWIPKKNERYFTIGYACTPESKKRDEEVEEYFNHIKCFKTSKEVEEYLQIHAAFNKKSFTADWLNFQQEKWMLTGYNHKQERVTYALATTRQEQGYCFAKEEDIKKLITKFGDKQIAKYILDVKV